MYCWRTGIGWGHDIPCCLYGVIPKDNQTVHYTWLSVLGNPGNATIRCFFYGLTIYACCCIQSKNLSFMEPLKKTYQVCIPPIFLYFFYFLNIIFLCILFSNFLIAIVTHSHLTNSFHVLWGWSRRIKSGGNVWSFPECDMSKEYLTRHKVCFVDCVRLNGSGYAMPLPQCLKEHSNS